jgi:hypothetical protein
MSVRKGIINKVEPEIVKATEIPNKFKAHTKYKNKAGIAVPGVTGVLSILGKPFLIAWANRMGLQGMDTEKYKVEMGTIGTIAHAMISSSFLDEDIDLSDYTPQQIEKAVNCYRSYLNWREKKLLAPMVVEQPLISEEYQYGGTTDFFGLIDSEEIVLDYKTGQVSKDAYIQTCAYRQLIIENGYPAPKKIIILGIPRADNEKFQEVVYTDFTAGWECFKYLLGAYNIYKDMK